MSSNRAMRPLPLLVTALVAFVSAVIALGVTSGEKALAHGNANDHAVATAAAGHGSTITQKELALRNAMRHLWEDHITWTRLAIISLTTDAPDTDATVARLLQNQTDIGDAVKPFYGKAAGDTLTAELRRHILIAAELVAAAKAGDDAALADAQARWRQNADDIATVLASVNPRHWKLATMTKELGVHLKLTTDEAVARLQGDWEADIAAYDAIHEHALHFADLLSDGLIKQFPKRFR